MGSVGEEEHDPIKLKSIKTNKTFTVPQNDRVRKRYKNFPSAMKNLGLKTNICHSWCAQKFYFDSGNN